MPYTRLTQSHPNVLYVRHPIKSSSNTALSPTCTRVHKSVAGEDNAMRRLAAWYGTGTVLLVGMESFPDQLNSHSSRPRLPSRPAVSGTSSSLRNVCGGLCSSSHLPGKITYSVSVVYVGVYFVIGVVDAFGFVVCACGGGWSWLLKWTKVSGGSELAAIPSPVEGKSQTG